MNTRWITGLLTAACLLLNSASALAQSLPDTPLRLGVVPQFPSVELQRNWAPIAQVLAQACGRQVRFQVSLSIPEFESQFLAGEFDIAYMNPYHAVMARQAQGYQPLVREGQRALKGILVVRADSELKSIADLAGQRIAYPAPNAFGASLYMRAMLEREHRVMTRPDYVRTHSNAYRHVIAGQSAAAGGVMATFKSEPAAIRDQLRVLYETPPVAPHPLMAHPRVSREATDCISQTLLQGETDPATAKLLAAVQLPHPVAAVYQRDYQPLERLSLDRYVVLEDKP